MSVLENGVDRVVKVETEGSVSVLENDVDKVVKVETEGSVSVLERRNKVCQPNNQQMTILALETRLAAAEEGQVADLQKNNEGKLKLLNIIQLAVSASHCRDRDEGVPYPTIMSLVLFTSL